MFSLICRMLLTIVATMSETQGRRHGDLPVTLLNERYDWVPPKSHDPDEIAVLQEVQPGTLITAREARGIRVAQHFMYFLAQQEGVDQFGPARVAEATYGSAYYDFGKQVMGTPLHKRVGRKRTYLPVHKNTEGPISRQSIALDASNRLAGAHETANELVGEMVRRGSLTLTKRKSLGLQLANTALLVASTPYASLINGAKGPNPGEGDDAFMQDMAHMGMEDMFRGIQETTIETGINPGLAQLALTRSSLTTYIDNRGGAQASEALEYGQDMASSDELWYRQLAA